MRKHIALLFIITLIACSTLTVAPKRETQSLSQQESKLRFNQVSDVHYDLYLNLLDQDKDEYLGEIDITFNWHKVGTEIRVDFHEGDVKEVKLNNREIDFEFNDYYISFAAKHLQEETNKLNIVFSSKYTKTGDGLYRFVDPKDKRVYVYTNFEPYDAHRLAPFFDQPDLKATYSFKTLVPSDWEVLTSVRESRVQKKAGGKEWVFPKSEKYSTYIFPFHAGPYYKWEEDFRYPLRLFARQSLKDQVPVKEWFEVTKQGFDYFDEYFGVAYPYKKYDQVLVPDFNAGAMENVAAVTFSERFAPNYKRNYLERMGLANVVLHEMAHMWFGNLVTMKWWDGLWLNESFATIMAYKGLAEGTNFKDSWRTFHNRTKQWAYWEDQLPTSHPIQGVIEDTDQASSSFDGITYGKGASVIKQMIYYLGDEQFKKGIQKYFKTYQGGNTEIGDFFGSFQTADGSSLDEWVKLWLNTYGVNHLTVDHSCKEGKLESIEIRQYPYKDNNVIRPHQVELAFLEELDEGLVATHRRSFLINSRLNQIAFKGNLSCPKLIYPNANDYAYVKVRWNDKQRQMLMDNYSKITDPYLRQMIYIDFVHQVNDTELAADTFMEWFLKVFSNEKDYVNRIGLLKSVTRDNLELLERKNSTSSMELLSKLNKFFFKEMKGELNKEIRRELFDAYIYSSTKAQFDDLIAILQDKTSLGFTLDLDRRWNIVKNLAMYGHMRAIEFADVLINQNSSDYYQKLYQGVLATQPIIEVKKSFYQQFMEGKLTVAKSRAVFGSLLPFYQQEARAYFRKVFYQDISKVNEMDMGFASSFVRGALPLNCEKEAYEKFERYVSRDPDDLNFVLINRMKKSLEMDKRCQNKTNIMR